MSVSLNDLSTSKQDKLTAGTNINITDDAVINCTMNLIITPQAIGSYCLGGYKTHVDRESSKTIAIGTTKAGSSLYFGIKNGNIAYESGNGKAGSGTWKLMHQVISSTSTTLYAGADVQTNGLWQRIS